MKPKHQRLIIILLCLTSFSTGLAILLTHFSDQLVYFYSPSQLKTAHIEPNKTIRIGGLVKENSVLKGEDLAVEFIITDGEEEIMVHYTGILPNLFREGQGMVATGTFDTNNRFITTELLAKHDENYMPPEVVDSLKATGKWRSE